MTRVSRLPVNTKVYDDILETFWEAITKLKKKEQAKGFFEEFLSEAEKTMLAKRLAIAVMLLAGRNYQDIVELVKVSTGTIRDVGYKLDKDNFRYLVEEVSSSLKSEGKSSSWLSNVLSAKTSMKARAKIYRG